MMNDEDMRKRRHEILLARYKKLYDFLMTRGAGFMPHAALVRATNTSYSDIYSGHSDVEPSDVRQYVEDAIEAGVTAERARLALEIRELLLSIDGSVTSL